MTNQPKTAQEFRKIQSKLFNSKLIQLPNNGGTVFRTDEVMRAINAFEALVEKLQLPEPESQKIVLPEKKTQEYWAKQFPADEIERGFNHGANWYEEELKRLNPTLFTL